MRFLALSACVAAFVPKHDPPLSARGRWAPKLAVVETLAQADVRIDDEALALFDRGCAALDAGECSSAAAQLRRSVELDATRAEALGALHAAAYELLELAAADNDMGPAAADHLADAEACWRVSLRAESPGRPWHDQLAPATALVGTLRRVRRDGAAADVAHDALLLVPGGDETAAARAWLWTTLGALIEDIVPARPTEDGSLADDVARVASPEPVVVGAARAALTPEDCYLRAIEATPDTREARSERGQTYKRLAEWRALTRGAAAADGAFAAAARLLPSDISCATHAHYGAPRARSGVRALRMTAPPRADETDASSNARLRALTIARADGETDSMWGARAAACFERDGVVVLPRLLDDEQCAALDAAVAAAEAGDVEDFTDQTHEASGGVARTHRALPLGASAVGRDAATASAAVLALDAVARALWPPLSRALQVAGGDADDDADREANGGGLAPLLGAGFMRVAPGARAQALHRDVQGHDRHPRGGGGATGGGPRAVSVQIQLTDTTSAARSGSLEVLPGSHRPDGAAGARGALDAIAADTDGVSPAVVPIAVPRGTVTAYSSRLFHRGGGNRGDSERTFVFLTVAEPDAPAPFGLIHTMGIEDVGQWEMGPKGLVRLEPARVGAVGV